MLLTESTISIQKRLIAEAIGTGLLVVGVVGSGIMAQRLTDIVALQLLCNAVATGGALVALITIFAPVSGASFNPAVGIVGVLTGETTVKDAVIYSVAQIGGGCCGAAAANVMFDLDAINVSHKIRSGSGVLFAEMLATVGLLLVIYGTTRAGRHGLVPFTVAAWIAGAYFFTSSTSMANPAVTIARSLSDTFAGIAPRSVPMFLLMQLCGTLVSAAIIRFVFEAPGDGKG